MSDFTGKVVLVTGGTAGIGLASVRLFLERGAHVYFTGRNAEEIDAVAADLGGGVTGVRADSSSLTDMDRLVEMVRRGHERIDVLHVNPGTGEQPVSIVEVTPKSYDEVFATNTRGAFFTVQKVLELMPSGASIVLTGSTARTRGPSGMSVYAASKAALRSFARTWASDLATRQIRVNLIDPGAIDTRAWDGRPAELRTQITAMIPAGRFGHPEEIAAAVAFLAGDDARFINGAALAADGGMHQI